MTQNRSEISHAVPTTKPGVSPRAPRKSHPGIPDKIGHFRTSAPLTSDRPSSREKIPQNLGKNGEPRAAFRIGGIPQPRRQVQTDELKVESRSSYFLSA